MCLGFGRTVARRVVHFTSGAVRASSRVRMEIRIRGYLAASHLLQQEPGRWHALVILGSGMRPTAFVESQLLSHLYLHFDDIDQPHDRKRSPTSSLVERGLA